MGFYLDGYILRPARVAPANAPSTSEATTGVNVDHVRPQDHGYQSTTSDPVTVNGLMYQAAVLNKPTVSTDEYCIWAATTGMLSTPNGDGYCVEGGAVTIPTGTVQVIRNFGNIYNDGVTSFLVQDEGGRDISNVLALSINAPGIAGLNKRVLEEGLDFMFDVATRKVTLTLSGKTKLGGGFSVQAGDVIQASSYSLSPPTFWWCRNDSVTARFGWDGKNQRWAPYQGSSPINLGLLEAGVSFTLSPKPTRFEANGTTYLPGSPANPDGYALLRVGLDPDSSSDPIHTLVVLDSEAAAPYSFTGIVPDAIVGEKNGIVQFNPNAGGILELKTGLSVWYNPETFVPTMDGDLGRLDEASETVLVLSPIPGPTDRPFLRYGWRQHLRPIPVESDAMLPASSALSEGNFAWSMTTGKIVLSETDMNRATPGTAGYELAYLGTRIYYDGVSMTQEPLPLRNPVPLELEDGTPVDGITEDMPLLADVFVPRAKPLPFPGTSGVMFVPDGTGKPPSTSPDPETRPNGSGLVRAIGGIGDSFVFAAENGGGGTHAFANLNIEEYQPDLKDFTFRIPNDTAEVARIENSSASNSGSLVQFRRRGLGDSGAFFTQAEVLPCVYSSIEEDSVGNKFARVWSRNVEPFILDGSESLEIYAGTTSISWDATTLGAGTYTAEEIAADITVVMQAASLVSRAKAFRGRVCLEATNLGIEIGWGSEPSDIAGPAALGFLPGWKTSITASDGWNWLPDNGMSFGFFRSPENVDAKDTTADIAAVGVINSVLTESIPAVPFLNLSIFPLEDVPGYDMGVHFRVVQGLNILDLKNYDGLYYDFVNDRITWTGIASVPPTSIQNPASTLQLGASLALPDTVSSTAMAPLGTNFGLYLKEASDTATTELVWKDDFLLPGDGAGGQALLTTPVGSLVTQGAAAFFSEGYTKFQDKNVDAFLFPNVYPGYLLRILNGDAEGVYTVTANNGDSLEVSPPFAGTAGNVLEPYGQWRIYEGFTRDVYDPALVADVQQEVFDHFATEPWKINTLSLLGNAGTRMLLSADAATALERGRLMKIRYTPQDALTYVASEQATVTVLQRGTLIGAFTETAMVLPDVDDSHFTPSLSDTTPYFAIRLGPNEYSAAQGNLSLVTTFTASLAGDVLEVGRKGSPIEGKILAGSGVQADSETAYYDQVFLKPSLIPTNTCEMNPNTGQIILNEADEVAQAGQRAYFVEQMISEKKLDVTTAPLTGSLLFNEPLREGQIVEVDYYQADDNGDKALDDEGNPIHIVEYLPLIVRLEEASRVDGNNYTFNPTGKTYFNKVEPFVWVGADLQNYGGTVTCAVESDGYIRFAADVPDTKVVKINYGVLEAFGGEQAYSTSTTPVFRKPFFLEVGQSTFVLEEDRTSDFVVGALMLVGTAPFYVKSAATYVDPEGIVTTAVEIWPPPITEVGSRAPGGDATTSLSAVSVAITIDPEGSATTAGGAEGFLMEFPDAIFLPVDRGALSISFYGDYREYTKPQHLLELGGYPFVIGRSTLSEDGRYTVVTLATPSPQGFSWDSDPARSDSIRISVRPVILPGAKVFVGVSPFLGTEEYECFILGEKDSAGNELPGKVLVPDIHFTADPANGRITFTNPTQRPLLGGERLYFRYTRIDQVAPIIVDGAQYNPIYRAKNLSVLSPSLENGLLGSTLAAKFTYSNPDTFYCRVVPLVDYLSDVGAAAVAKVSSSSASGGPLLAFPGAPINYKEGNLGLRGSVKDAKNLDQGARAFLEFFNSIIVAWEQVLENIDGRFIGDRDGKFRLFVGHGKPYAPPGYENIYTGELNSRNLWRLLVEEWSPEALLAGGYVREKDGIYGPTTYEEDTHGGTTPGDVDGVTKPGGEIENWIEFQRARVKNDIDDRVLTGLKRGSFWATLFPWLEAKGKYEYMWQPHELSRIYPEKTLAFTRLFPGYGAVQDSYEGYYTAGRTIEVPGPEPGETTTSLVRTRNTNIGIVSNPVFEDGVPNISDIDVRNRKPRARIWAYYPEGSQDLDDALGTTTVGFATLIVTPLPFSEFPIDPATGFPDTTQLISNGGSLPDAASGDFNLATPGFEEFSAPSVPQQLYWGKPDGKTGKLWGPSAGWTNPDVWSSVYVENLQLGCVITLQDQGSASLTGATLFKSLGEGAYEEVVLANGDTLFVGGGGNPMDADGASNPPDDEDLEKITESLEDYRVQYDIGVNRKKGIFIDKGLSKGWANDDSFPLNLQGLFAQKPPPPLSAIEADVSFTNTGQPIQIPALKGEAKNDSGDVAIPYMASTNTELAALGEAAAAVQVIFDSDTTVATPLPSTAGYMANEYTNSEAVYPTEIPSGNTFSLVLDAGTDTNPNVLYTTKDMQETLPPAAYTAKSGEGSVRPYDFLLVEAAQPLVSSGDLLPAFTGILSIADVQSSGTAIPAGYTSAIETPRFVSHTTRGQTHRYTAYNVFANNTGDALTGPGTKLSSIAGAFWETHIDLSSVAGLTLDDGFAGGNGGLWNVISVFGNAVRIEFYSTDAAYVGDPLLATLIIGSPSIGSPVFAINEVAGTPATQHRLDAGGIGIDVGVDGGPMGNRFVIQTQNADGEVLAALGLNTTDYYDFTISVDTYITAEVALQTTGVLPEASGVGTTTARIERDRLTFSERLSFANAMDRDALPQNGDTTHSMGLQLNVWYSPLYSGGAHDPSDVNACAYDVATGGINGGTWVNPTMLTFKTRTGPSPDGSILAGQAYVGTYVDATADGAGDELGLIRTMAFEYENASTSFFNPTGDTVSGIRISPVASSNAGVSSEILEYQEAIFPDSGLVNLQTAGLPAPAFSAIWSPRTWVEEEDPVGLGDTSNVEAGDIVMVGGPLSPDNGSVKAGSYIVRHAIKGNAVAPTQSNRIAEGAPTVVAGSKGWLDLRFPVIQAIDSTANTIKLNNVPGYLNRNGTIQPSCGTTGELFVILKSQYATYDSTLGAGSQYTLIPDSVYRIDFSGGSYDADTETLTANLDDASVVDAAGAAVASATFYASATVGRQCSYSDGRLPVLHHKLGAGFPKNNVIGAAELSDGTFAVAGFGKITAGNTSIIDIDTGTPVVVDGFPSTTVAAALPSVGEINYRSPYDLTTFLAGVDYWIVACNNPKDSDEFEEERRTNVYSVDDGKRTPGYGDPTTYETQAVPEFIKLVATNFSGTSSAPNMWNYMHFTAAEVVAGIPANILACHLPGDKFLCADDMLGTNPGHAACAGVFLEPSVPISTITGNTNLNPRVVAESFSDAGAADYKYGSRAAGQHGFGVHYVDVSAVVRRIRRFHDVSTDIVDALYPLRYVYETRRGLVDQTTYPPQPGDTTFTADMDPTNPWGADPTTLGMFDDPGMNINGGDVLRLLDVNGAVVDTAEVLSVDASFAGRLRLRQPGFTASNILLQSAVSFEVYLEQAPVPHEQSHDQLLSLLTDVEVRRVGVDYSGGATTGAYVDSFNAMKDDTLIGTWEDEGVQKGDYIIVDPAGTLYIDKERGARAVGDVSTKDRIGGHYDPGGASELDDNRGFYLVEDLSEDTLTVTGSSRFCGGADDGSDDVVFGTTGTSDYVVLPTIHNSTLNGWVTPSGATRALQEGQQALRPTAPAVVDGAGDLSYKERDPSDFSLYKSIGPFGYRIIRTSPVFSTDATELVLFQRARFLSWMEDIQTAYDKGGTYYIFQKENHIEELPSSTDPTAGLGVLTNDGLTSLSGETDGAPFENCSDCVSILDRRFWVLDYRLDTETNPVGDAYTTFSTNTDNQRPVLIDYIEGALDMGDKFREQRFSWITFRADRVDGSIIMADREERRLPRNLKKQRTLALQRKALDES